MIDVDKYPTWKEYAKWQCQYWSIVYWDGYEEACEELMAAARKFKQEVDKVKGYSDSVYLTNLTRHRAGKSCHPTFVPLAEAFQAMNDLTEFWCQKGLNIKLIRSVKCPIISNQHPLELECLERVLEKSRKEQLGYDRRLDREARSLRFNAKKIQTENPDKAARMRVFADDLDERAYQLRLWPIYHPEEAQARAQRQAEKSARRSSKIPRTIQI